MAKKKNKPSNQHAAKKETTPGVAPKPKKIEDFARSIYQERSNQFQRTGTSISEIFEGLDFSHFHVKRRIASSLGLLEEIQNRFQDICPDIPGRFSLAEDWVTVNAYPISAYDHVENHIYSVLAAAIWILDQIRDTGKLQELASILTSAPIPESAVLPPVWDSCHSQQMLSAMVSVIRNRNADCLVSEKRSSKGKPALMRCYMDKCTAEKKIDHSVISRVIFEKILQLIDPDTLAQSKSHYTEQYWDWLRRYFQSRAIFAREEMRIRAEIEEFHRSAQELLVQGQSIRKDTAPSLFPATSRQYLSSLASAPVNSDHQNYMLKAKGLAVRNDVLYRLQEDFNARFEAFTREVGEFSLLPYDNLAARFGREIADCWAGFEITDPYSMCAAFLLLLDEGSDLPWCYFPGVHLQSCYVSMLPWTRTKHIGTCDDIWEHYDAQTASVIPGPTADPLPKKIKVPDPENWYELKYADSSAVNADSADLYNLSQVIYEITGCIMPRNLNRHKAALKTLSRYGINNKKTNQYLSYCIALLGEAKHQSTLYGMQHTASEPSEESTTNTDGQSAEELKAMIRSLQAENSRYKQAAQTANLELSAARNRLNEMETQAASCKQEIADLGSLLFEDFGTPMKLGVNFPYRTASHIVIYGGSGQWLTEMKAKLPDITFHDRFSKGQADQLRRASMVWLQTSGMSHREYKTILQELRKHALPVRYFSGTDVSACAAQLVQADIASC